MGQNWGKPHRIPLAQLPRFCSGGCALALSSCSCSHRERDTSPSKNPAKTPLWQASAAGSVPLDTVLVKKVYSSQHVHG